ncbi:MAG: DHH family phosphoesterase [Patescibacteria group bacterium]|nr:DHH family phosphoesterase [Patescibacteria group bacterium]
MPENKEIYINIKKEIDAAKNILLITHKNPDGDAAGSMLALASFLEKEDKNFTCLTADPVGDNLVFLPNSLAISQDAGIIKKEKFDLLFVLDSSDLKHTNMEEEINEIRNDIKIINIDHHFTNIKYGDINHVIDDASSTCEVLFYFLDEHRAVNKTIATCLLTGIMTDTGGFQNSATTPGAINIASTLMNKGVNLQHISKFALDAKPVNTLKLWGRALQRLKINNKNKVISTVITQKDLDECNATEEAMEGVANFLNELDQAQDGVVMVLSEREEGKVKGSLRTTNPLIDVSKLAKILGGGGHKKAAGFSVDGKLVETENGWQIV